MIDRVGDLAPLRLRFARMLLGVRCTGILVDRKSRDMRGRASLRLLFLAHGLL